ncbi:hypothetical protein PHLCEN_2v8523 [Hermanssonia centrifuga]|uniref:Uncharacterized protein n=1 Tax=Hermanssonia centrifuga TaxID=98765 RepID=A0A2R6NTK4_9APHY|nr:hypothetical protein PHLCEN_2v8523 [Hermanssonia centrifuga]
MTFSNRRGWTWLDCAGRNLLYPPNIPGHGWTWLDLAGKGRRPGLQMNTDLGLYSGAHQLKAAFKGLTD